MAFETVASLNLNPWIQVSWHVVYGFHGAGCNVTMYHQLKPLDFITLGFDEMWCGTLARTIDVCNGFHEIEACAASGFSGARLNGNERILSSISPLFPSYIFGGE